MEQLFQNRFLVWMLKRVVTICACEYATHVLCSKHYSYSVLSKTQQLQKEKARKQNIFQKCWVVFQNCKEVFFGQSVLKHVWFCVAGCVLLQVFMRFYRFHGFGCFVEYLAQLQVY